MNIIKNWKGLPQTLKFMVVCSFYRIKQKAAPKDNPTSEKDGRNVALQQYAVSITTRWLGNFELKKCKSAAIFANTAHASWARISLKQGPKAKSMGNLQLGKLHKTSLASTPSFLTLQFSRFSPSNTTSGSLTLWTLIIFIGNPDDNSLASLATSFQF